MEFLPSGHSHNEQDQRFQVCAVTLVRAPVLEDATEVSDWLGSEFPTSRARGLHVEVLDVTCNFVLWLVELETHISGLAATHHETQSCHVWRITSRRTVNMMGRTPESIENHMRTSATTTTTTITTTAT